MLITLGWILDLKSSYKDHPIIWDVYFGPHGIPFPNLIPKSKHKTGMLKPNTHTTFSFSMIKKKGLPKRGFFQSKLYCEEEVSDVDLVSCHKKCFLSTLNVSFIFFNLKGTHGILYVL